MLIERTRQKITNLKDKKDFPFAPLEAVGPNLSGWGVVETTLLLPGSVCLMVGPLACLRHSAFMAQARGFFNRFYMLPLEEVDIVMGKHLPKVKEALKAIVLKEHPQILILAGTCCDHILGTDYKEIIQAIKDEFGIEVIYLVMAPLTIGLKPSPFEIAYTALFEFLKNKKKSEDQDAINILGTFLPLSEKGELYTLLKEAGFKRIYQIPTCKDINELEHMANVCLNLVIHPLGNILAKKMQEGMGIPYIFCPLSYGLKEIDHQYQRLEGGLKRKLNYNHFKGTASNKLPLDILKGKRVAVGCSINGSPFELACALKEFGAEPKAIFARNAPKPYEWKYIKWLSENSPETYVYNVAHPYLNEEPNVFDDIELAFGVDAGIYCSKAVNIPLSRYQKQVFGYECPVWLFEELSQNISRPISNYDWIYKHNLLI